MLKRIVLAAVAAVAFVSTAAAADMPKGPTYKAPPSVFNWSGFYVGATIGGAWAETNWTNAAGATTGDFNGSGIIGGLTVGFNRQLAGSRLVWGIEADISASNVDPAFTGGPCGAAGQCVTELRALGTIRGRLGYAMDRSLLYVTGGASVGWFDHFLTGPGSQNETLWGWNVGGGIEFALWNRWSAKLEYLYTQFEDGTFVLAVPITIPYDLLVVRVGLNYRW